MTQSESVPMETHVNNDFIEYINYSKNRPTLIESKFENQLKELYDLLYLYSQLTSRYKGITKRNKTSNFINENKVDLMISFDLLNINYLKSSKKTLRSAIESFFRFSLEFARYSEYERNKKLKKFKATDSLKELKSMVDTHKVGNMTRFTLDFFKKSPVYNQYFNLNEKYSYLSSYVHSNSIELFTPHSFLSNYKILDHHKIDNYLKFFKKVLLNFLVILYSHDIFYADILDNEKNFSKSDIIKIEYYGKEYVNATLNNLDEQSKLC